MIPEKGDKLNFPRDAKVLNDTLLLRTFLTGKELSVADYICWAYIRDSKSWNSNEGEKMVNLTRWFNKVAQMEPIKMAELAEPKMSEPKMSEMKMSKQKSKDAKAKAAAGGGKKSKKKWSKGKSRDYKEKVPTMVFECPLCLKDHPPSEDLFSNCNYSEMMEVPELETFMPK